MFLMLQYNGWLHIASFTPVRVLFSNKNEL